MSYKINLNEEDYLLFNIFYAGNTKTGKRSANLTRLVFPLFSVLMVQVFFFAGAAYGLIATEAAILAFVSVVWWVTAPKLMEKMIRRNIGRMKKEGKLPYHADAMVEFQDDEIVEISEQGEIHIPYMDIENVYFEREYLYIFYGAVQAFIIPCRCLGGDRERVTAYIREKVS